MDDCNSDESVRVNKPEDASKLMYARPPLSLTSKGRLVGRSPQLVNILQTIDRVAHSPCSVLVAGESGTGKRTAIRALHDASARCGAPLVAVRCSGVPESALERDLFGPVEGGFPGAPAARQSRIAMAERGTLLLEEVSELPLSLQVKLLCLLEQREYTPIGELRAVKCDVRVVATTRQDLEREIHEGRFREDLFYRLNVIHLPMPPLRERREDIEPLAMHFLRASAQRSGRDDLRGFSLDALALLSAHDWPGNVRALENTVERAVLLAPGPYVRAQDLSVYLKPLDAPEIFAAGTLPDEGIDLRAAVAEFESHLIRQALAKTGGNKNKAAQLLRINRTTLVEMVKRKRLTKASS